MPGTLFVVATPIGNLDDITARALRVLREVALIAAEDTRRTAHLLARHGITTPSTSLHEHNEARKSASLVERLKAGASIALVSDAGTPTISDPGTHFIREVIAAGIRVEPVPGPSAVLTALAASGFTSDTFLFLGFPPIKSRDRSQWLDDLKHAGRTVVFFEAPHRIHRTLRDVLTVIGDRHIVVARELTKRHEELVRGPILQILSSVKRPIGEFTVIVEIGHKAEIKTPGAVESNLIITEFGELTKYSQSTRREIIADLARRHGMSRRAVYSAVERAKKSVV